MTTPADQLEAAARQRIKEQDGVDDPDPGVVANVMLRLEMLKGDMAALERARGDGSPVTFEDVGSRGTIDVSDRLADRRRRYGA